MNEESKKFLEFEDNISPQQIKQIFDDYKNYLYSIQGKLPKNVFDFAIAEWHYNPRDHRCPHDSWLETLNIFEIESVTDKAKRHIEINISLLGAYHNGKIELSYKGVKYYSFEKTKITGNQAKFYKSPQPSHGDWILDEIHLSKDDLIIHTIDFAFSTKWIIYCEDITYEWKPFNNFD